MFNRGLKLESYRAGRKRERERERALDERFMAMTNVET